MPGRGLWRITLVLSPIRGIFLSLACSLFVSSVGAQKKPPLEAFRVCILRIVFGFVIRPSECLAAATIEYRKTGVIIPGLKFLAGAEGGNWKVALRSRLRRSGRCGLKMFLA